MHLYLNKDNQILNFCFGLSSILLVGLPSNVKLSLFQYFHYLGLLVFVFCFETESNFKFQLDSLPFQIRKLTQDHTDLRFPCNNSSKCRESIHGPVVCRNQRCKCENGHFMSLRSLNCVRGATLDSMCNNTEQCKAVDPNSYCLTSPTLDPRPLHCQCSRGFIAQTIGQGSKACRPVDESSLLGGVPHFDSRDTVPVIMGCLAASLALLACCAGIVQLMKRKRSLPQQYLDQNHRSPVEEPSPQEMIVFHNRHHMRNGPHIAGPDMCETVLKEPSFDPILDLPPTYTDVVLPPSYEEAMLSASTSYSTRREC